MAKEPRRKRASMLEETVEKTQFQLFVEHVIANPALYGLSFALIVLLIILGGVYSTSQRMKDKHIMTEYTRAISEENTEDQLAKLEALSGKAGRWNAEVLYVLGETAIAEQDYERAKKAFEQVRSEYADSEYAPRAVDGLGFLAENAGDNEEALTLYREVLEKWGGTLAGKREQLNIGRVCENLGKLEDAKAAYEAQLTLFADSQAAKDAQSALNSMKEQHPELFPAPPEEAAAPPEEEAGAAAGAATPAAATDATPVVSVEAAPAVLEPEPENAN